MPTSDKSKPAESPSVDLLSVIRASGIMNERQLTDLKSKVLSGEYPHDAHALAERLVREKILTEYQTKRFLNNKSHGIVVGRYAILDRIGSGSMGRVYKAQHMMMDRVVALKIIAPEITSNDRVVARFQREMKLVGRLDHPNVVRAFDADQINKVLYIAMEFVAGQSLVQVLRKGTIPAIDVVQFGAQAALGLAHAHEQGIVHRDIKPSNLLLTDDSRIKVLDLGLGVLMEADDQSSFATADGIAVGTIDYMSPEQACGRDVDGRSDLYSLGCSMYHLMSGRVPFPGDNPVERLGKRLSGRPTPISEILPDVPSSLVQVLDKLIAVKPADRFQNAAEAAEALQMLTRPRVKKSAAPAPKPVESVSPPAPPVAPPPPQIIVERPDYPRWFLPLANLAEDRPRGALATVAGTLAATFLAGFGLAWLFK